MKPQREGMIWQVLWLLVVLVAFLTIRSAEQQFTSIFNQKYAGWMDVVWPFAIGLFAAFLLLAGAAAMISGHVLRVMCGSTHRGWAWNLSGLLCCLAGIVAIVFEMAGIALSRGVGVAQPEDFFRMLTNGSFAIAISGGYVFLLGVMLLMADRRGKRLRSVDTAEGQRVP